MTVRSKAVLAAAALLGAAGAASADIHIVDFFPEEPQNNTLQLRFIGPIEGTITNTRLVISFTTLGSFDAADLAIQLVTPVTPDQPGGGFWFLTGQDLGWSGQGTFTRDISTTMVNGTLNQGLWGFDLGSLNDPPAFGGSFSMGTRFEVTIVPAPAAAGLALLGFGFAARRRR